VGVLVVFSRVYWPFLISFSLYFRFESQERHNRRSTQPLNEVLSHVPSCRSDERPDAAHAAGIGLGKTESAEADTVLAFIELYIYAHAQL